MPIKDAVWAAGIRIVEKIPQNCFSKVKTPFYRFLNRERLLGGPVRIPIFKFDLMGGHLAYILTICRSHESNISMEWFFEEFREQLSIVAIVVSLGTSN
jgi:hypothetical protein